MRASDVLDQSKYSGIAICKTSIRIQCFVIVRSICCIPGRLTISQLSLHYAWREY